MTAPEVALIKAGLDFGGTFVVMLVIAMLFYRIVIKAGPALVKYAAAFVSAQERQAQAMTDVKEVIREYVMADNSAHREMLLGIQVTAQEIRAMGAQIRGFKKLLERKNNDEN